MEHPPCWWHLPGNMGICGWDSFFFCMKKTSNRFRRVLSGFDVPKQIFLLTLSRFGSQMNTHLPDKRCCFWREEMTGISSFGNQYIPPKNHCTLISFTILIPASQPVWPAGRFRFGVIWPAGRFGVIWPAGQFRRIWPAGRFRKIWPAGRFRTVSEHLAGRPVSENLAGRRVLFKTVCFGTYFTHVQNLQWTASVHTLHMSKPNVTRVQSATERTASVHTLHMSKPNVTRVQSATERAASVHTLHMSKPNVTRVQRATQSTASVHTLHMSNLMYLVFKVLRNALLRYILYTCPNLM